MEQKNEEIHEENQIEEDAEAVLLKIGEVADFFQISVKAVRIYEKKGILVPAYIDPESGYRYYTPDQLHQLAALLELKALGFSLDEIKDVMVGESSKEALYKAMQEKLRNWENLVIMAQSKMDAIESISERLVSSKEAEKLRELTEEERAWLLVKLVCVENVQVQSTINEAIWL
ncbi:MAG: MerR family transcriptional regulator [Lachnospiraceae bacterium]|nr:MerR family transcriptional regulator [Lachnospiraceae bacterium]